MIGWFMCQSYLAPLVFRASCHYSHTITDWYIEGSRPNHGVIFLLFGIESHRDPFSERPHGSNKVNIKKKKKVNYLCVPGNCFKSKCHLKTIHSFPLISIKKMSILGTYGCLLQRGDLGSLLCVISYVESTFHFIGPTSPDLRHSPNVEREALLYYLWSRVEVESPSASLKVGYTVRVESKAISRGESLHRVLSALVYNRLDPCRLVISGLQIALPKCFSVKPVRTRHF